MITIKSGHQTNDRRLDRIPLFDVRSREFPVRALGDARPLVDRRWALGLRLDQGSEGACVGFGVTHGLAAEPILIPGLDARFAREEIYWGAQKIDRWPGGSYPGAEPQYEGTAVLAGLRMARKLKKISGFHWAFGLQDVLHGLCYTGPVTFGFNWYEGMMKTDEQGFIHPTGQQVGGHCIDGNEIVVGEEYIWLVNSWGSDWGVDGRCKLSWKDLDKLLGDSGEAAFMLKA